MIDKINKKKEKETYLKRSRRSGYIFDALAGFGDWAPELNEEEVEKYLCDASSISDINRWFNFIIYPALEKRADLIEEKLEEFIELYEEGELDKIFNSMSGDAMSAVINLKGNNTLFLRTLVGLAYEKINLLKNRTPNSTQL